jgi:hypothetical protein
LQAQGVAAAEAKQKAERVAAALVQKAAELKKEAAIDPEATTAPEAGPVAEQPVRPPPRRRVSLRDLYEVSEEPYEAPTPKRNLSDLFGALFGSQVRFLLGAVLLLLALAWMYTNGLTGIFAAGARLLDPNTWQGLWLLAEVAKPLPIPMVPEAVLRPLCSLNAAVAGLLLLATALWGGARMGLFQLLAAALMIVGPFAGVPAIGPLAPAVVCLLGGAALSVVGFLVRRRR